MMPKTPRFARLGGRWLWAYGGDILFNFDGVVGLSGAQLRRAFGDATTVLPPLIARSGHWPKPDASPSGAGYDPARNQGMKPLWRSVRPSGRRRSWPAGNLEG